MEDAKAKIKQAPALGFRLDPVQMAEPETDERNLIPS